MAHIEWIELVRYGPQCTYQQHQSSLEIELGSIFIILVAVFFNFLATEYGVLDVDSLEERVNELLYV